MRDLETDTASCLQPLVLTPSSKVHILWSLIGSLFIVSSMLSGSMFCVYYDKTPRDYRTHYPLFYF